MHGTIVTELCVLLSILTQCLGSFRADFSKIDCRKPDTLTNQLIPGLVFKIQKIADCAKSLQKIFQSLKKDNLLPCLRSVDNKP